MKMEITKKLGNKDFKFTFEGRNLHECVIEAEKLSFYNIPKCGKCESELLELKAYKTKEGYEYTKIVCNKCKASITFGQKRDDSDVFFMRKNSEGKLDWKESTQDKKTVTQDSEDYPF